MVSCLDLILLKQEVDFLKKQKTYDGKELIQHKIFDGCNLQ